jgi:hypothetical protein
MDRRWSGVREHDVAGAHGVPFGGQVPMPVDSALPSTSREAKAGRSWWRMGARIVRNAVIALVVITLVPVTLALTKGDRLANVLYRGGTITRAKMAAVEPARSFRVATDPSITPTQAGAALNALRFRRVASTGFETITPSSPLVFPWRANKLPPDMFISARPDFYEGPSSMHVLEAAAKGFSAREQQYLRALAEAPVWREFDLVARAPAIDILGGQFKLPFGADALPEQRPLPSFRDSKEIAYAAIARAAYYMSVGRTSDAEQTLRSVVSFGFAFIDNGNSMLDELVGTMIVGLGRDALQRFYVIQHDPRASRPELMPPARLVSTRGRTVERIPADEVRAEMLKRLEDPALPRAERFEMVHSLTLMQCANVRTMMFGQADEVSDAIARARTTLARYPSERTLVDLQTRMPSLARVSPKVGPLQSLAVSSSTVAGVVLNNPRLATCSLVLSAGW